MGCWDCLPPPSASKTAGSEWNGIPQEDHQNIQGPKQEHTHTKTNSSPPLRTPLLEQVTQTSDSTSSAMAQYYLTRFGNESTEETRRELAWPHLLRAAELGRPDAELLVAHAHLSSTAQQTETWWDLMNISFFPCEPTFWWWSFINRDLFEGFSGSKGWWR